MGEFASGKINRRPAMLQLWAEYGSIWIAIGLVVVSFGAWVLRPSCAVGCRDPDPATDWKKRKGLAAVVQEQAPRTGKRYLIVGTGSVGLNIIDALVARGEMHVAGFDIAAPKRRAKGVTFVQGSVNDLPALLEACKGVDVVFATFALIRYYERLQWQYAASHDVNVLGTENMIQACQNAGVKMLIQTSTSNVCTDPSKLTNQIMDEESTLVTELTSPNHYGWTKVQAECAVLAVHSPTLRTVSVRPCSGIFGSEDIFITEKHIKEGHAQIFIPEPTIDYVYVENVVLGHLLAEAALESNPAQVGGQAFCISNNEPFQADNLFRSLKYFYDQKTGKSMKITYLPRRLLVGIAYANEAFQSLTRRRVTGELAPLTPAMVTLAKCSYSFSSAKAKRLLGYEPLYTVDEALQRTVSQSRHLI